MKIILFEYITSGGLNCDELPKPLAREGSLMLQALLDGLTQQNHDLTVMLDSRVTEITLHSAKTVIVHAEDDSITLFKNLLVDCDAVWLIAPEFDRILETLCEIVETSGTLLLTSSAAAVAVTADKFSTYQRLRQYGIATVPTLQITPQITHEQLFGVKEWLIKPACGVGCMDSYVLTDITQITTLNLTQPHIIQPHLHGEKTSLSCLFKNGLAWLLTVNLQHFELIAGQYQLQAITVNYTNNLTRYESLVAELARAFPELWGYVGIDLIETPQQILVLEINPRLTSSFIGINAATGINVCTSVLQLLNATANLTRTRNQPITLQLT